ncbi:hypothetical protein [Rhodococcus pyridinivorans]|uniref:hypothetical protein n=1 Tax=Rhodococcus pyridinivorans TaxID=103816 RepID=UPI003AAE58B9
MTVSSLYEADDRELRRMRREEAREDRNTTPAFRVVDDIPNSGALQGRQIPEQRQQLIDFTKANPGKWIEYQSTDDDPYKSASQFVGNVRQGKCGFAPKGAFEAASRNKLVYIRYVAEAQE